MKKYFTLLLVALLALNLTACAKEPIENKPQVTIPSDPSSEAEALKLADLNFLCENLEKNHKNIYAKISKEDFQAEKQKIIEKLPDLTDSEFFYELKQLVAKIGDAHTRVGFSDSNYKHLTALPFAVSKFSDGWHLAMLEEQSKEYLGYQLVAINDVPIEEVYSRAKSIISHENNAWATAQFSNTINFADPLKFLKVVTDPSQITLSVRKDSKSTIEKLPIKSMNEAEIMNANILSLTPESLPSTAPSGIYSSMELDETAYYIQYNSCQEDPKLPMKNFVSNVASNIESNSYKKIIVDLRYNSGGNSSIFEPMISALKDLQKKYNFSVYTLIGDSTFSSAIINSVQLKNQVDSTLVGSQTGGNVNSYGEVKNFTLPNSPIMVSYSIKYFELIKDYDKDSLYPDISVVKSYDNYMSGVDSEVQAVLGLTD